MDRTLYLRQSNKLKVARDGPSLWITERGRAGRRVPARLVGRVIIIGNLRLDAGVITLFAEHGVPVSFMTESGKVLATVLAHDMSAGSVSVRQICLTENQGDSSRAKDWLYARRKYYQAHFIRAFAFNKRKELENRGFTERQYSVVFQDVCHHEKRSVELIRFFLSNLLHELLVAETKKFGFNPHIGIRHRGKNFSLCKDLTFILGGLIDELTTRFLRIPGASGCIIRLGNRSQLTTAGIKLLVGCFEKERNHLVTTARFLLDDYFRLIRDISG